MPDVNRTFTEVSNQEDNTTDKEIYAGSDAFASFRQMTDGEMQWGSGSATPDANLYRSAADELKTDDTFDINALKIAGTAVNATAAELNELDLSAVGAQKKYQTLALTAATHGTGSEVDTGLDLPANCIVTDVFVNVTTAEATATTKTIDIGTLTVSNDPDGFAKGLSVASTGIKRPQVTVTAGCNETYFSANTRGALLSDFVAGADTATDVGTYHEKPDVTSGADDISITSPEAFTEFAGTLIIEYIELA